MSGPSPGFDRNARHQLLLTRIAVDRVQMSNDLQRMRHAAQPARLLAAGWAATPLASLFGAASGAGPQPWAATALAMWRRWRRVAPVVGLLAPLLPKRRWLRRTALLATVLAGWWASRRPR